MSFIAQIPSQHADAVPSPVQHVGKLSIGLDGGAGGVDGNVPSNAPCTKSTTDMDASRVYCLMMRMALLVSLEHEFAFFHNGR